MAEFCPVLPAGLYKKLDVSYPGAWHFVHAPQVLWQLESSTQMIEHLSRFQGTVILDCYAFELSGLLPCIQDVYEAATVLSEGLTDDLVVVCPDILKDGEKSFGLLKQHGLALSEYGRLLIVPHGLSLINWMTWADQCIDLCRSMSISAPIVGLPRYMCEWGPSTRFLAATWLHHYYHAQVHLLGAGLRLREVLLAARAPNVLSCDSTLPFAHAMEGLNSTIQTEKIEMDPDWWHLDNVGSGTLYTAQSNIALWKEALRRDTYIEPYL